MKKAVLFLILVFICSCATYVYKHNGECGNFTKTDIMSYFTTLLLQHGFIIKYSDEKIGYIHAETMPELSFMEGNVYNNWDLQFINNKIILIAYQIKFAGTNNQFPLYYNDNIRESEIWYWEIRKAMEEYCGKTFIVEKIKK
jgi:hypothetical protein